MEILDRVFDVLSEERRRYALYYLEQQDGPVSVEELVEQIAAWETDGTGVSIPDENFREIKIELYHTDLPKTATLDYVEYNRESGEVELTEAPPQIDAIVSVVRVMERPDRNRYRDFEPISTESVLTGLCFTCTYGSMPESADC